MGSRVPNIAKGRELALAGTAGQNLIVVLLTGVVTDDALEDCTTLSALLAICPEVTDPWYSRRTLPTSAVTVDNVANTVAIAPNTTVTYNTLAGAQSVKRIAVVNDGGAGGTDASRVPLFVGDCVFVPDGTPVLLNITDLVHLTD